MPMAPMTNDAPAPVITGADTLNRGPGIPTSATSDMPVIETPAETVDTPEVSEDASVTSDQKPEGEADGTPSEAPGEEKDKTSPQQRAVIARERNRRQAAEAREQAILARFDKLQETVSKLVEAGQPKEDEARPVRANFDDPDAYDKALETWVAARTAKVVQAEAQAEQTRAEQERNWKEASAAYAKRAATFKTDHPDFEDVVYGEETLFTNPVLGQALLEAEDGPAIAYYLAQNQDEHDRISALRPAMVVFEVGKIAARLAAPPAPTPKPRQDPIVPLKARNPAGPKDPNDMSMEEYAAYRKSKAN